ncbi:MAG: hypothetical protein ACE5KJ_05490 [Candidatus Zixiibacteriota bacterium]
MRKIIFSLALVFGIVCLTLKAYPAYEFGKTLEKPEWGMIEWSSATLPQGFWYARLEFIYAHAESYFAAGREVDFRPGRDSTAYLLEAGALYGLSKKANLSICIPFILGQRVKIGMWEPKDSISGVSGFGDIQLALKYHLIDRYFWSVATELSTTLPTGIPHNKVSSKERATGDGQTDLNLSLNGDILLTEEAFVKLGTRFVYQFKRRYREEGKELLDEKLGNSFGIDLGFVKNFKNMGIGGALQYTFWQATKVNKEVIIGESDLFNLFLQLSLGNLSPEKHGKIDLTLDFPLTGKNASATYRLGISLKTIFR